MCYSAFTSLDGAHSAVFVVRLRLFWWQKVRCFNELQAHEQRARFAERFAARNNEMDINF
jgi:hypothetical protein